MNNKVFNPTSLNTISRKSLNRETFDDKTVKNVGASLRQVKFAITAISARRSVQAGVLLASLGVVVNDLSESVAGASDDDVRNGYSKAVL